MSFIVRISIAVTVLLMLPEVVLAAVSQSGTPSINDTIPSGMLSCPPQFVTEPEQRLYAKDGMVRSGPWHAKCFQNGMPIYDHDRLYLSCQRNDKMANVETAEGHAVRFSFPPEIACIWER